MKRENLLVNVEEIGEGHGSSCLRDVAETTLVNHCRDKPYVSYDIYLN